MMRRFIAFFLATQLLASPAFGALPPTTIKPQSGSKSTTFNFETPFNQATKTAGVNALIETGNYNLLKNPGFEATTYSTSWTASGGSSSSDTSSPLFGVKSYVWNSSSAAQTLTSDAITVPEGMKGQVAELSCAIQTASGSATHTLNVYDGSNILASKSVTSSTEAARTTLNFTMPSSGTVAARLVSVASDEPSIEIDDCYLGSARNISNISQATVYGTLTYTPTANCSWGQTASTTFAGFAADNDCPTPTVTGRVSAPTTKIPAFRLQDAPAGHFVVLVNASMYSNTASREYAARLHDGTNAFGTMSVGYVADANTDQMAGGALYGSINYATPQSDVTIQIQAATDTGNNNPTIDASTGGAGRSLTFTVLYFPSSTGEVYRFDETLDNLGHVFYVASSTCPAGSVQANGAAVSRTGYAALFGRIGTTFGTGDGSTTFNVPDARGIFIRGAGSHGTLTNANGAAFSGTLGTQQNDQMQGHIHQITSGAYGSSSPAGGGDTSGGGGAYNTPTIGGPVNDSTNGPPRTGVETRPANISLTPCISTVAVQAPVFLGSVISNSAGTERIERASITCKAASTINSQSGSWLSLGNISSGACTGTMTGFSATPTCIGNVSENSSNVVYSIETIASSATSLHIGCRFVQSGSSIVSDCTDVDINIHCMGPR